MVYRTLPNNYICSCICCSFFNWRGDRMRLTATVWRKILYFLSCICLFRYRSRHFYIKSSILTTFWPCIFVKGKIYLRCRSHKFSFKTLEAPTLTLPIISRLLFSKRTQILRSPTFTYPVSDRPLLYSSFCCFAEARWTRNRLREVEEVVNNKNVDIILKLNFKY